MRAPRFPLHLTVRYRAVGNAEWRQGQTENISSSGVLLQGPYPLQPDTVVEFMLALASATGPRTEISCRGRVVRTVQPIDVQRQPVFAVAIEQYDFIPPARPVAGFRETAQ
jgi:PilZ domain